jgi:uncharacterized protein (DUF1330 family)
MAAYIIALRERIKDAAAMEVYAKESQANVLPVGLAMGLKLLAVYGRQEPLEGVPFEGAVLMEFPTFELAQAFYNSPEYQRTREHRLRGADYTLILFDGV